VTISLFEQTETQLAGGGLAQEVKTCVEHPIRELIHEDPFTRRAFEKPRGYDGDTELLCKK